MKKSSLLLILSSIMLVSCLGVSYAWFEYLKNIGSAVIVVSDLDIEAYLYTLHGDIRTGEIDDESEWFLVSKENGITLSLLQPGEGFAFKLEIVNNSKMKAALDIRMMEIKSFPLPLQTEESGLDYFTLKWGIVENGLFNFNQEQFMRQLVELTSIEDIHTGNITMYELNETPELSEAIINEEESYTLYFILKYSESGLQLDSHYQISKLQITARQINL